VLTRQLDSTRPGHVKHLTVPSQGNRLRLLSASGVMERIT
jgi:hypothetical protein